MIKQIILIILLSVATIIFRGQVSNGLEDVVYVHNYIAQTLHVVFSDDRTGRLIQDVIALLLLPVVCGGIIAFIFWLIKRNKMPYTMSIVWVVWLVLLVTMLAQNEVMETTPMPATATAEPISAMPQSVVDQPLS